MTPNSCIFGYQEHETPNSCEFGYKTMDLDVYCTDLARRAREAARVLATATGARKNAWLQKSADALEGRASQILEANARDIAGAAAQELTGPQIDRLRS